MQVECCICYYTFTGNATEDVHATTCGHIFHNDCLQDWLTKSRTCPQCRTAIPQNSGIKLYFQMNNGEKITTVKPLSEDVSRREVEMKGIVKTAIKTMQKLDNEFEHIFFAKSLGKDSIQLSSYIREKLETDKKSKADTTIQGHLKYTEEKISNALNNIAVFEEKMFVANKSLIELAENLKISGSGDSKANTTVTPSFSFLPKHGNI